MGRRLEKKSAYIISTASWIVFMLAILLVPQGARLPVYIIAFGVGLGVSSAHVLLNAMGPDVVEVDELLSGQRQEELRRRRAVDRIEPHEMRIAGDRETRSNGARYGTPNDVTIGRRGSPVRPAAVGHAGRAQLRPLH